MKKPYLFNLEVELREELETLAARENRSLANYLNRVLKEIVEKEKKNLSELNVRSIDSK